MFLKFDNELANDAFLSFVICSYKRADMTIDLVNSIHQYCDCPFEIIVHDDHSDAATVSELLTIKDKVSTLILGGSEFNMGLSSSFNRGVALANSKYIVLLNNDIRLVAPGIRRIAEPLSLPYIGILGPIGVCSTLENTSDPDLLRIATDSIGLTLSAYCGSGSAMAFRKEVWQEIGGFDQFGCGSSDTGAMFKVMHAGYFNACFWRVPEEVVENVDAKNDFKRGTIGSNRFDGCYPTIFKGPALYEANANRKDRICHETGRVEFIDEGHTNGVWWDKYNRNAFIKDQNNYDWDKLKFHAKWKDLVESHRLKYEA